MELKRWSTFQKAGSQDFWWPEERKLLAATNWQDFQPAFKFLHFFGAIFLHYFRFCNFLTSSEEFPFFCCNYKVVSDQPSITFCNCQLVCEMLSFLVHFLQSFKWLQISQTFLVLDILCAWLERFQLKGAEISRCQENVSYRALWAFPNVGILLFDVAKYLPTWKRLQPNSVYLSA